VPYSSNAQSALLVLGRRLRELREDLGTTQTALAQELGWHSSKLSRIEHGKQTPSPADITAWCRSCDASEHQAALLAEYRAVGEMFTEWHRMDRDGLSRAQRSVDPLWRDTRRFKAYESWMIPGILQTRAYTKEVLGIVRDARHVPIDDVEEAVDIRMNRQEVLHRDNRRFAILLEESVLHHQIGDAQNMVGQLGHLLAVTSVPSVSLGIIRLNIARRRWPVEGFWAFDDKQVNVELLSGWLTITQQKEVATYLEAFSHLGRLAVHGPPARRIIAEAMVRFETKREGAESG
jgi:transcriptional regulator with XRE-family HTH domain